MLNSKFQQSLCDLDPKEDSFVNEALSLLAELDKQWLLNADTLAAGIHRLIAEIDHHLSQQVSKILHAPEFAKLEATWRGVETLTSLPVNYQKVRIKIIDMSWDELSHELNSALTLRRTNLYNLIGNKELNTSGGQPFGMVVVDHDVSMDLDGDYDDLYTVELLANLGDICLCPFILSTADNFFGEPGADWLSDTARVKKILEGPEYVAWQRLRKLTASRFIGLTLPKVKLRERYHAFACHGVVFQELAGKNSGLWGSAAYLFASITLREFSRINWFGFMKSRWQDKYYGALVNLPKNGVGSLATLAPCPDIRVITEMGTFYANQGFIPLCHSLTTDKYFFKGNNSIWDHGHDDAEAVMGQIQTTLMICRIAHYLKVQIRGMIGNFQSADECERFLNNWLDRYSSNLFNADESTLAKYPLSKGRVEVREIEGEHGRFSCDVLVQPQYQFDNVCGEVLLSTDLGSPSPNQAAVGGRV